MQVFVETGRLVVYEEFEEGGFLGGGPEINGHR